MTALHEKVAIKWKGSQRVLKETYTNCVQTFNTSYLIVQYVRICLRSALISLNQCADYKYSN